VWSEREREREIKRKERVVHDSIARSASASVEGEKENARGRVSPELNKPKANTVCGGVLGFSHPVEKTECMWYMVTVVDKWCGGSVKNSLSPSGTSQSLPQHRLIVN